MSNENVRNDSKSLPGNQQITLQDLLALKAELLAEIRHLFEQQNEYSRPRKWLKSYEVRQILNLSANTLHTLRCKGILPYTKIGGAMYYDYTDIQRILNESKSDLRKSRLSKR